MFSKFPKHFHWSWTEKYWHSSESKCAGLRSTPVVTHCGVPATTCSCGAARALCRVQDHHHGHRNHEVPGAVPAMGHTGRGAMLLVSSLGCSPQPCTPTLAIGGRVTPPMAPGSHGPGLGPVHVLRQLTKSCKLGGSPTTEMYC